MKPDCVILDADIYISLILSRKLEDLVTWSKDYDIDIFICKELYEEIAIVLKRERIRKNLTEPVSHYLDFIKTVTKETNIDLRFDRAPDLKDNYLFDLAYTVKSYYLVTHDYPLLNMKQVNKIKIISASEWRKTLRKAYQ